MFLSRYTILMSILALLLLSLSSCASDNSTKLISEKDISVRSSDYTQKGREFTVFATLRNPYDYTITGNLTLLTPVYFEIDGSPIRAFTIGPYSSQTFRFNATPILIRENIGIFNFINTWSLGALSGKNKLYFNIDYGYKGSSIAESCSFVILVIPSYITLFLASVFGGVLGSFLKILTIEKDLKVLKNISKWRPLLWGVLAASLAILIQPLGGIYTFQGAILVGAAIGYSGSSILEDMLARG